jgi:glycosidase
MKVWEIAILALIVLGVGGGYGAYKYGHHQGFAQGYSVGHKIGYSSGVSDTKSSDNISQSFSNNISLQTCLDGTDKWYNSNRASLTTIAQENALNDEKDQNIKECQLRYPTH